MSRVRRLIPCVEPLEAKIALDAEGAPVEAPPVVEVQDGTDAGETQQLAPSGGVSSGVPPQPIKPPTWYDTFVDDVSKIPADVGYIKDIVVDKINTALEPIYDWLGSPTITYPVNPQPAPDVVPDATPVADAEITPARIPGDDIPPVA